MESKDSTFLVTTFHSWLSNDLTTVLYLFLWVYLNCFFLTLLYINNNRFYSWIFGEAKTSSQQVYVIKFSFYSIFHKFKKHSICDSFSLNSIKLYIVCVTQSWNFFHQLYNYSKKYFMRPNKIYIYLESARRDLQNGVKILVKFFSFANLDIW